MRRTRVLLTLLLALLVVTAGCSGGADSAEVEGGGSGDAGGSSDVDTGAEGEREQAAQSDGSATASGSGAVARREVIRTGEVYMEVDDFAAAEENLTAAVQARGGFVSDTTQEQHGRDNQTWTSGTLVLRVPRENFSALLDDVEAEGEVRRSTTKTEDVTDQVVDLEARLKNLRAERDRLRTLYDQANETEDVLRVGQELSKTQEQIERLEAQLRTLEGRIAYSTLTVNLSEPEPEYEPTRRAAWYETSAVTAFLDSIDGVVVVLRALFVGAAYAAPYAIVFGVPLAGAAMVVLRRRRRV